MASSLNEANLEKKLNSVTNTQESIQTLSLWCIHHKAHYKKIVETWLKVIKKSKPSHRLALFYLANDVIQNSRRKGNNSFQDAWNLMLRDAIPFVKDDKIRPQIERIFNVWESRNVFDSDYITELKGILGKPNENKGTTKSRNTANAKLLAEFKSQKLIDKVRKVKKFEAESELKHKHLTTMKIDVSSTETLRQLKVEINLDRAHGDKFSQEFEDGTLKLSEYVQFLEQEVEERTGLIEMLEKGEIFYDTQRGEAKIVANAYKNFGSRVKNLKKKLDEMKSSLPSPIPSPTPDAPSPADSSVDGTPVHDTNKDNTEAIDMEMSDEETDGCTLRLEDPDVGSPGSAPSPEGSPVGLDLPSASPPPSSSSKRKETVTKVGAPPSTSGASLMTSLLDTVSGSVPALTSKNSMSLDSRLSNLMQNIPSLSPAMHSGLFDDQSGLISLPQSVFSPAVNDAGNEGGGTPLKDEGSATGSATPLQDEDREASKPVKLLSKIMLKIGGANRNSSPTVNKNRDPVESNAWDNSQVTHVQADQNSKVAPSDENESMSISEFFKKIGSSFAGTQSSSGATKRDWSFPKTSPAQPKRATSTPFQTTTTPSWFPKGDAKFDSFVALPPTMPTTGNTLAMCQSVIDSLQAVSKQPHMMDLSDRLRPDVAPTLISLQLADRKPGDNQSEPIIFRNELDPSTMSVGENLPADCGGSLLEADDLQPVGAKRKVAPKRNLNIVELNPSTVRTGSFGKDESEVRMSSNLITLVQNVDDGAVPKLPEGQNNQPPGLAELNVFHDDDDDEEAVARSDNANNEHHGRAINATVGIDFSGISTKPMNSMPAIQTLTNADETTYSRIETVGTRRDSTDNRRFLNDGEMYNRRYDAGFETGFDAGFDRRPEWDNYPPPSHPPPPRNHGFQRSWMPKENWENNRGFKQFGPRPRFPSVPNRYPPPPHPDGRRPFYTRH